MILIMKQPSTSSSRTRTTTTCGCRATSSSNSSILQQQQQQQVGYMKLLLLLSSIIVSIGWYCPLLECNSFILQQQSTTTTRMMMTQKTNIPSSSTSFLLQLQHQSTLQQQLPSVTMKRSFDTAIVNNNNNNNNKSSRNGSSTNKRTNSFLSELLYSTIIVFTSIMTIVVSPTVVYASSYIGSLSTEQKVVAEAWRLVDNSFLDRTFNHQDWFNVRQKYVVQNKYKSINEAQNAITEMIASLGDPYTRYLLPSQYQSLVDSATGSLTGTGGGGGIGIEISKNKDTQQIYASDIQENSPAMKAGISINDIFIQVNGQSITPINTPDDVAVLLRGPIQSKVGIVMEHDGTNIDYIIQREAIQIKAVQSYVGTTTSGQKVGIIRIKNFSGTTASVVQTTIQELQKKNPNLSAYLIDLRGNPGGLLPGGVDTASLFLSDNVPVVYVVNKSGIVDTQSTLSTGFDISTPISILVDKNTASAAEVFTAALQENHRALVLGEQTFGKGIVQTIRELSDHNGGIAITVARYETPNHNNINKQGIIVNIPTPVTCPKNDAIQCIKNIPNTFQSPPIQ